MPCEHYFDRFAVLVAEAGVPRVRLHDLRHTSVSLMRAAGIADRLVAARHGGAVMRATYDHAATPWQRWPHSGPLQVCDHLA